MPAINEKENEPIMQKQNDRWMRSMFFSRNRVKVKNPKADWKTEIKDFSVFLKDYLSGL
jgi:hypothetical protein